MLGYQHTTKTPPLLKRPAAAFTAALPCRVCMATWAASRGREEDDDLPPKHGTLNILGRISKKRGGAVEKKSFGRSLRLLSEHWLEHRAVSCLVLSTDTTEVKFQPIIQ